MTTQDAESILAEIEALQQKRAEDMPTQEDALRVMLSAFERLKDLGWAPAIYSPKDGTVFEAIEAGCRVAVAGSAFFGQNSDNWPYLTQTWKGMLPSDCATSAQCCCRKQQTNTE